MDPIGAIRPSEMAIYSNSRSLILAAIVLTIAIGVTFAVKLKAKSPTALAVKLCEAFPSDISGWTFRDLPLGSTEVAVEASKEILGFDDYINREYTNGTIRVGVYIAYWKPGRVTARMVRGHVPDNCWVSAGWVMQKPTIPRIELFAGLEFERRTFTQEGLSLDVAYAQIVGGKVDSFSKAQATGLVDDLMHYWDWRTAGQKEQYFVRISSNDSMEQLSKSPLFRALDQFVRQYVVGAN